MSRMLPFAFPAPDIVEAVVEGAHPDDLTVQRLKRLGALPSDWKVQCAVLGFDR